MPFKNEEARKAYHKKYNKKHYQENKEKYALKNAAYEAANKENLKEIRKEWSKNNKDKVNEHSKKWRNKNSNYQKIYREENKDEINKRQREWRKEKMDSDPDFKLRALLSQSVAKAVKKAGASKTGSILKCLPYSISELHLHLEKLFEPWMNWNNHGKYNLETWDENDQSTWTWQLDHIIPQLKLPYSSMADDNFKKCWDLTNLRPLCSKHNLLKGAK